MNCLIEGSWFPVRALGMVTPPPALCLGGSGVGGVTHTRHGVKPPTRVGYSDAATGLAVLKLDVPLTGTQSSLVAISSPGVPKIDLPFLVRVASPNTGHAMANIAAELIWITHLLRDLNALPSNRLTVLCDNLSAIFLSQNPVAHRRAKHIDIDYHFVRELVSSGKLHTKFVPTKLQVANTFKKPLPRLLFESFRNVYLI
nr:hypothetical protein [Tanacetum cinerariifolium]